MAHTTCLVCFISTVNGHSKKKRKKRLKCGASSGLLTNLKQSSFSFDIYDVEPSNELQKPKVDRGVHPAT